MTPIMEGRICFEYRWGLKPVPVYAICHTKPIFDFDFHNKRSNTPNNMSSRKRSNTYWSTNTFAPSVAICCPNNMSSVKRSNMYWSTNMSLLKQQYIREKENRFFFGERGIHGAKNLYFAGGIQLKK